MITKMREHLTAVFLHFCFFLPDAFEIFGRIAQYFLKRGGYSNYVIDAYAGGCIRNITLIPFQVFQ